jgi:hypothetical protein
MGEDFLFSLKEDFYKVAERLKIYSLAITQKFDDPLFFVSFENLSLPFPPLIFAGEMANEANYYAAYVGILKTTKIINNLDLFKENYKNPGAFCCLIYIDDKKNNKVIYIPYEKK